MPSTETTSHRQTVDIQFENIVYEVPAKKKFLLWKSPLEPATRILHQLSGHVTAGTSLGILGPSGSGKTSLLNVLAARTEYPPVSGTVLFGGRPRVARTKRHIGYVMQDDVFFSKLTVRETLDFTANIRISNNVSKEEKKSRVDKVIHRLRLEKCQHTRIGDQQFDKGISGGERKRVNIANELLHDPSVLLADEATSGLDSSSAYTVIHLLKELCAEGRTVVCTIHQPSSQMFSLFDNIMLLAAGRVAYFGTPGGVIEYFSSIDFPFPEAAYNPADFVLELVIDDSVTEGGGDSVQERILKAWEMDGARKVGETNSIGMGTEDVSVEANGDDDVVVFLDKPEQHEGELGQVMAGQMTEPTTEDSEWDSALKQSAKQGLIEPTTPDTFVSRIGRAFKKRFWDLTGQHGKHGEADKYPNNWFQQVAVLGKRSLRQKKGVLLEPIYMSQVAIVTLVVALAWFRIDTREGTIEDRLGALAFISIFWAFFSTYNALFTFPAEKQVLNKDRAGGAYRLSAYYFAKSMIDTPADMIYPTLFSLAVYFMMNLNPWFPSLLLFSTIMILNVLVAQSIGLLISAIVMDVRKAQVIASICILTSMLLGGYYIDPDNIPKFLSALRSLSFIKYTYEALVRVEMLNGRTFDCEEGLGSIYSSSCPIRAEQLLQGAQLTEALSIPLGMLVLIAFIVLTRILGYFALKLAHTSHKPRRSSWMNK